MDVAKQKAGCPNPGEDVALLVEPKPVLAQDGLSDAIGEEVPNGVADAVPKADCVEGRPKVELGAFAKAFKLVSAPKPEDGAVGGGDGD